MLQTQSNSDLLLFPHCSALSNSEVTDKKYPCVQADGRIIGADEKIIETKAAASTVDNLQNEVDWTLQWIRHWVVFILFPILCLKKSRSQAGPTRRPPPNNTLFTDYSATIAIKVRGFLKT